VAARAKEAAQVPYREGLVSEEWCEWSSNSLDLTVQNRYSLWDVEKNLKDRDM
jgi:hypothetical protein